MSLPSTQRNMQPRSEQQRQAGRDQQNPPLTPLRLQSLTPRDRISHACDRCRAMRTRCSGGIQCKKCCKEGAECIYSDRRREQNKKLAAKAGRIESLEHDKALLLGALRELSTSADLKAGHRLKLSAVLQKVTDSSSSESTDTLSPARPRGDSSSVSRSQDHSASPISAGGKHSASSEVGSAWESNELHQIFDLDTGSGMVGFVGKMSETSWMRRISEYLTDSNTTSVLSVTKNILDMGDLPIASDSTPTPRLTYFMDEDDLLSIDEDHVNHYQVPPLPTSLLLSEAFFHALQGSYPFISHIELLKQLPTLMADGFPTSWSELRLLGLCNLIWATGAKWLQTREFSITDPQEQQNLQTENHLVYYARARALGCDHRIQFDRPDVQMLQSMGIMAFYLFVNGSLQRAWNVLGQAIRHAISLGLHLKLLLDKFDKEESERRKNLWYSLYRLETLLAEILGRPTSIQHEHMVEPPTDISISSNSTTSMPPNQTQTQPQPQPQPPNITTLQQQSHNIWIQFLNRYQWTPPSALYPTTSSPSPWPKFQTPGTTSHGISASYFPSAVSISRISTEIASKLFSNSPHQSWWDVQRTIQDLEESLTTWLSFLPQDLTVDAAGTTQFDPRANLDLAMYFYSMQMLLYRPCLCEIEIEDESVGIKEFNLLKARECVQAAVKMVRLLPTNPVPAQVLQVLPWGATLHYICQAGTVILLEMCLDMQHLQSEQNSVVAAALKTVFEYLRLLAPHLKSAFKAYQIFRVFVEKVAQRYGASALFGWGVEEPNLPRNWTENDDEIVLALVKVLRQPKTKTGRNSVASSGTGTSFGATD